MSRFFILFAVLAFFSKFAGAQQEVEKYIPELIDRTPAYALKTSRTLWAESEIAHARQQVASVPEAQAILKELRAKADFWANKTDEQILELIPPASVPRAFSASSYGDPIHGNVIYEKFGTYPWKLDPERPYVVISPIDGAEYPSNDYAQNLKHGFTDADRQGQYFDDGWGWVDDQGRRYWFVGYACHWHWRNHVLPGMLAASRVYTLTGEKQYAHTAAVMLTAIAKSYPALDYDKQSRYGAMNGPYDGKILNAIWETFTLQKLAESYDNVWETIDADKALQETFSRSGESLRALIEANILEEGIDAVASGHISGNFGMHQRALTKAVTVRQYAPTRELLQPIMNRTGGLLLHEGTDYAMYNYVHRDGMSMEGSPQYNRLWSQDLYSMAKGFERLGMGDLINRKKLRDMAMAPLKMLVLGWTTPAIGDSGSATGWISTPSADVYRLAQKWFDEPLFDWWVARENAHALKDYEQLFDESATSTKSDDSTKTANMPSTRIMDGYGLAILEDTSRQWGLSFYYGYIGGHGHRDGLNFELYGYGQKVMPDQGYPDARNNQVSGIFSWSENTVAHNCVMIDREQQRDLGPGELIRQFDAGTVKFVEAETEGRLYKQADTYRRAMLMVETRPEAGYVVDIFTVRGGNEHHYSVHGPVGEVDASAGTWSAEQAGTLAGENVQVGELYDSPVMNQPDYTGGYQNYFGSGFSHFQNVRQLEEGSPSLAVKTKANPEVGVVIHLLPQQDQHAEQVIWTQAQISPLMHKDMLPYLIENRQGSNLESRFVSILEPVNGQRKIQHVSRRDVEGGVVLTVEHDHGRDVIIYRDPAAQVVRDEAGVTDGAVAVLRYGNQGDDEIKEIVLLGGKALQHNGVSYKHGDSEAAMSRKPIEARVQEVDYETGNIVLAMQGQAAEAAQLQGLYPQFSDGGRIFRHPIAEVQVTGSAVKVEAGDELRIGRGRIASVEAGKLVSRTDLSRLQGIYTGTWLADAAFKKFYQIDRVKGKTVYLKDRNAMFPASVDDEFWICTIHRGAKMHVDGVSVWRH